MTATSQRSPHLQVSGIGGTTGKDIRSPGHLSLCASGQSQMVVCWPNAHAVSLLRIHNKN